MANNIYGAIGLTGGTAGLLDAIDGAALADKDIAVVVVQGVGSYTYVLNATSGAAESSPGVIAPDANGGDKRWILQPIKVDHIEEATATHGVVIDGVQLKDGGALAIVGGTNTFNVTNGTASLDVAAGAAVNVDANLTVETASTVNQDLTSDASPTFVTVKLSGLTDLKVPKHVADATGLADTTITVSANNEVTNASQPAFLARNSATDSDVTGDGTSVTVDFDDEIFDQNDDFASDTFTAPVTGRYLLTTQVYFSGMAANHVVTLNLITSNRAYIYTGYFIYVNQSYSVTAVADMDVGDTATVTCTVSGAAKSVDVLGAATHGYTYFSGALLC